ncbi:MAG: Gfo/Idh/MocA family oxidoreductase, partial [Candidatus Latescibacteria bacterium]|nr:Gfo/Idh/MocA family oxidoreductase [Candidatus Latescibacterota bacterium]
MADESRKLKAVVAGWKWGNNHMRAFAESDVCDLKALWSRTENPDALRVASLYHVPLYTDFDQMLEDVKPNVASIAVPEAGHEALTISALESGCDVYCEKVLADTREAGQRMVDCAAKVGRVLNVGYNYRYSPSCIYMVEAIQAGKIGR